MILSLLGIVFVLAAIVMDIIIIISAIRKKPAQVLGCASTGSLLLGVMLLAAAAGEIRFGAVCSCLILTVILALRALVLRVRKRPAAGCAWCALLLFVCAVGAAFFKMLELYRAVPFAGLFLLLVAIPLLAAWVIRMAKKKSSRVLRWAAPGCAAAAVILLAATPALVHMHFKELEENPERAEISISTDYDFVVEDGTEPIEVIEAELPEAYSNRTAIYGSEYLYHLFGDEVGTEAGCIAALEANPDIPERFKDYFRDFIHRIAEKYPDATLTILQHNLKTLRVEELNSWDFVLKSLSTDSAGVYMNNENAIYIPEGTEYVEGTWGFQVLIHEFCHAARDCWLDGDYSQKAYFSACPESSLLLESMNSAFSCSLLDYYEWDIAYQVPSNYLRIMLECMDNYDLSDYMNHGDTYFYRKLDETAGYTNYAKVLWQLITLQRSDWENDRIDIDETEYYPIYDFLCELYYDRYLQPDMTPEEARQVADELVCKAFYDAPEGYKICEERFYDDLEARLSEQ